MKIFKLLFPLILIILINTFKLHAKDSIEDLFITIDKHIVYYPKVAENSLNYLLGQYKLSKHEHAQVLYYKGLLNYKTSNLDLALEQLGEAINYFSVNHNRLMQAKCLLALAWVSEAEGHYSLAIGNYYKIRELLMDTACVETGFANISLSKHNYFLGKEYKLYLSKGYSQLNEYGGSPHKLYAQYIKALISDEEDSMKSLITIANKYTKNRFYTKASDVYRIIASRYERVKQYDSAMHYVDIAIETYTPEFGGSLTLPSSIQLKGLIYYKQKDFSNALTQFNRSISLFKEYNLEDKLYYPYSYLYRIDTLNNDYKNAFINQSKAYHYKNKLNDIKENHEAKLMEISSNISQLEYRLLVTSNEQATNRVKYIFIIALLFALIIILFFRFKNKQTNIKNHNKELETLAINAKEKILMYEKQKEKSNQILINATNKNAAANFAFGYSEILNIIEKAHPELNSTDTLYALMFALDLPIDTICELQNVQSSSVRKARQRIRQKLNLDSNCDLTRFFKSVIK